MKELNLLERLWLDGIENTGVDPNDPNIDERKKMFMAGVTEMAKHMLVSKPDKVYTKEMAHLMLDLQGYWDNARKEYDLINFKKNKDN